MDLFPKLALASLFAFAQTGNGIDTREICPKGSNLIAINEISACCPGVPQLKSLDSKDTVCCVGGTVDFPLCFPFCNDEEEEALDSSSLSCKTRVPVTASDYSARVYGSSATATASDSASSSLSTTATEAAETATSEQSAESSTQSGLLTVLSEDAAGARATAAPVGAWALCAGIAAAAL